MLLDFYETGLGKRLSLSEGLDQAVPRSPGRENARVSGTDLGAAEKTIDAGAGLICRNWFEDQNAGEGLWKNAVGKAAHGGRTTLEYQLQHPEEADSIHVVNIGWGPLPV